MKNISFAETAAGLKFSGLTLQQWDALPPEERAALVRKATDPDRAELSFDGCGINGPDEYRTRLATFVTVGGPDAMKYGPLFAAAPELLAALKLAYELLFRHPGTMRHGTAMTAINRAIAKAGGAS